MPFALLLFGAYLGERAFKLLCLAIVLSSFVIGFQRIEENDIGPATSTLAVRFEVLGRPVILDSAKGPISLDHSMRIERMKYVDRVFFAADSLGRRSVVICGEWLSYFRADRRFADLEDVDLVAGLGRGELLARRTRGYGIYYLHGQAQKLRFNR